MSTLYDRIVASAKPWGAREVFKANYSELRSFGRWKTTREARERAIKEACIARTFWRAPNYRAGQAALAALNLAQYGPGFDVLQALADTGGYLMANEEHKAISRVRRHSYQRYCRKLP